MDQTANKWEFLSLRSLPGVSPTDASNDQPAIDVEGRSIYVVARKMKALLRGHTLGFDATNNVFLYLGRRDSRSFWLYRYGPGRRIQPKSRTTPRHGDISPVTSVPGGRGAR